MRTDSAHKSSYGRGRMRLWSWFGLSRASFCVLPRVLMHAMSDDWQDLAELQEMIRKQNGLIADQERRIRDLTADNGNLRATIRGNTALATQLLQNHQGIVAVDEFHRLRTVRG